VDYSAVVRAAQAAVAEGHTLLVETLAERIAVMALEDPRVVRARVTVEKPDAFPDAASVGVMVERCR
jgi:dihydroneopterin aldolase